MRTAYSGPRSGQFVGGGRQPSLCPHRRGRPQRRDGSLASLIAGGGLDCPKLGLPAHEAEQERHLLPGCPGGSVSDMHHALGADLSTNPGSPALLAVDDITPSPQRTLMNLALLLEGLVQTQPRVWCRRSLQKEPLGSIRKGSPTRWCTLVLESKNPVCTHRARAWMPCGPEAGA